MWPTVLVVVLAVTIGMQNTCPHGWATKTAFATCKSDYPSTCCTMHGQKQSGPADRSDAKKQCSNAKQTFVLNIVRPDNTFQILAKTTQAIPAGSPDLREIFSDPLFKPPIFPSLFS